MRTLFYIATIVATSFLASCSLKQAETVSIRLSIPEIEVQEASDVHTSYASAPEAVRGFDCIAFNVMGLGIASDQVDKGCSEISIGDRITKLKNVNQNFKYAYPGITSKPIKISSLIDNQGVSITLNVPTGSDRIFQAVGIIDNGSGICNATIPVGSVTGDGAQFYDLGRLYKSEIGGVSFLSLGIPNHYKASDDKDGRQINGCSGSGTTTTTTSTPVLTNVKLNNPGTISGDNCTAITGKFVDQNGDQIAITSAKAITIAISGITGSFYASNDTACTGLAAGANSFSPTQSIGTAGFQYHFKPNAGGSLAILTVASAGMAGDTIVSIPYTYSSCSTPSSVLSFTDPTDTALITPGDYFAQPFTLAAAPNIKELSFKVHPFGGGGSFTANYNFGIWSHNSGANTPSALITNASCSGTVNSRVAQYITCTLSAATLLSAGTTYWAVIQGTSVTGSISGVSLHGCDNASCTLPYSEFLKSANGTTWINASGGGGFSTLPGNLVFDLSGCGF